MSGQIALRPSYWAKTQPITRLTNVAVVCTAPCPRICINTIYD